MISAYSPQQVRDAEQPLLNAGEPLMQRAARGLAERCRALLAERAETLRSRGQTPNETPRVLVLVGPGSNGGDGLFAAAELRRLGVMSAALVVLGHPHQAGADALRNAGGKIHHVDHVTVQKVRGLLHDSDLVLDAIVGSGGRAEVPANLRTLLDIAAESSAMIVAVDTPSFVDALSGAADPHALRADTTVTFGATKTGLLLPPAANLTGDVVEVDIGLAPHLPAAPLMRRGTIADARALWRKPGTDDSKYTRGVVALAAGSDAYPGAAVLCAQGAARIGAGMVRLLAPQRVADFVLHARPEVITHPLEEADGSRLSEIHPDRTNALVVGPGVPPEDPRCRAAIDMLASRNQITCGVIDAGALDAITREDELHPNVVLTPHEGEARRMVERLRALPARAEPDPASLAQSLASTTGATVLLKGACTLIAPGDGGALISQADGTSQLATAGTGDVLAGIIGALLAIGHNGPDAAWLGTFVHGRAAQLASKGGTEPILAGDLPAQLPTVVGSIVGNAEPDSEGRS